MISYIRARSSVTVALVCSARSIQGIRMLQRLDGRRAYQRQRDVGCVYPRHVGVRGDTRSELHPQIDVCAMRSSRISRQNRACPATRPVLVHVDVSLPGSGM